MESTVVVPSYLKKLDPEQQKAAMHTAGPARVIASAGSGKTSTFVKRIEHMVRTGIPLDEILATTFTKKAAMEMRERLIHNLKESNIKFDKSDLTLSTMHSIAIKIVKVYHSLVGLPQNFSILKDGDSNAILDRLIKEHCGKDVKLKGKDIYSAISFARNARIPYREAYERSLKMYRQYFAALETVAEKYAEKKLSICSVDFDDILEFWLQIMLISPQAKAELQSAWSYVMIDEYQDTNVLQNDILRHMCEKHRNLYVVGDFRQSIYAFRAANVGNILNFDTTWPGCTTFMMNTNYRSTPEIVAAANSLIQKNKSSLHLHTDAVAPNKSGNQPMVYLPSDDYEQDKQIVRAIQYFRSKGLDYEDMMVLFRNNRLSSNLERQLAKAMIPFFKRGGRFWDQAHLKLALSWLGLLHNPLDKPSLARVIETYPGLGAKSVEKALDGIETEEDFFAFIEGKKKFGKQESWITVAEDLNALFKVYTEATENPLLAAAGHLCKSLEAHVLEEWENGADRIEDFEAVTGLAEEFATAGEMLEEIALQEERADDTTNRVLLSSIHGVKGLESKVTFMMSLNERIFPGDRSMESIEEIEEERRLMYVGMTRAKEVLIMYSPRYQATPGKLTGPLKPSRFLGEIDSNLLKFKGG